MSAYLPNPDRLSLSCRCHTDFLWSIPSHFQGFYGGVSCQVTGIRVLSGLGLLSLSTSYPFDWSSFVFTKMVDFSVMRIYSSHSGVTSVLSEFLINGLYMGKYAVSGTSVMTFAHRSIAYSSVRLKFPWHRTIHHWWIISTLFLYFQTTLIYSSSSLSFLCRYDYATIYNRWRY